MNDESKVEVYYPVWMQVVCILGMPALTIAALWLMTRPLWEDGLTPVQIVLGAVLGAAVTYQCGLGLLGLLYLRIRMLATSIGLEIIDKEGRRFFAWHELARPKHYTFAGMTRLSLRNGEILIYASDTMKNLHVIEQAIDESSHDSSAD